MVETQIEPDDKACPMLHCMIRYRRGIGLFECDGNRYLCNHKCHDSRPVELDEVFPLSYKHDKVCSYLCGDYAFITGKIYFTCVCEEETCAGCMQDGDCPIIPEIRRKLNEISSTIDDGTYKD